MGNSEILASVVPTDETSASFHSTPDFHNTPQTLDSYIYLEVPTTCISSEFYTGPHDQEISPDHLAKLYTGPTPVTTHTPGPHFYTYHTSSQLQAAEPP